MTAFSIILSISITRRLVYIPTLLREQSAVKRSHPSRTTTDQFYAYLAEDLLRKHNSGNGDFSLSHRHRDLPPMMLNVLHFHKRLLILSYLFTTNCYRFQYFTCQPAPDQLFTRWLFLPYNYESIRVFGSYYRHFNGHFQNLKLSLSICRIDI